MTPSRISWPIAVALVAAALLTACDRRPSDPTAPSTASPPPPVSATPDPAMPPASAASH